MKSILIGLSLFATLPLFALEISDEGRREAQLFNTYLEAVYKYAGDAPRAFAALQKALELSPDSKYLRRSLVSLAISMNKPELAQVYADYINMGENEAEDYAVYAAYQLQTGNRQEALAAYEKAVALMPENMELLYQYLLVLSTTDFDKMIAVLKKVAVDQPAIAAQAYTQIGTWYMRRQQTDQALVYFNKAIVADPNDPAPRLAKADIYERTSQFFLMLHEFEELEKIGYANAGVFSRMGAVFAVVKDFPKAEEYFLKAKKADAHEPASNYFLSMFAEQKGDYAAAIAYLKDGSDYSTNASHWLQVSFLQQKLNQPQESLKTLAEAYKRFEDNVEIGFFYGLLLNDQKECKKAAHVFKKLLQTRPDYIDARLHYAYALESLKKYKEMETQIQFILSKQPHHAPALNLLAYSLAEREVRLEEALELVTRALAVSPNDVSFRDTLGWIYVKQGKLPQAEQIFESLSPEIVNQYPEIAYHIAVLRLAQGRTEEGLTLLNRARTGWPAAEKLYKKLSR